MKKGLVILLSALVLASCGRPQRTVTPKSSDTKQTSTETVWYGFESHQG